MMNEREKSDSAVVSCEVHERGSVIRGEVDGAKGGAKGNVGQ
jgi:hypothetical protein